MLATGAIGMPGRPQPGSHPSSRVTVLGWSRGMPLAVPSFPTSTWSNMATPRRRQVCASCHKGTVGTCPRRLHRQPSSILAGSGQIFAVWEQRPTTSDQLATIERRPMPRRAELDDGGGRGTTSDVADGV